MTTVIERIESRQHQRGEQTEAAFYELVVTIADDHKQQPDETEYL